MKKKLLIVPIALLIMSILFLGCAKTAPAPAPSGSPTPTATTTPPASKPSPTTAAPKVNLIYWNYAGTLREIDDPFKIAMQRLDQLIPGRVAYTMQQGGVYGTGYDTAKVMKAGTVDMEYFFPNYVPSEARLLTITEVLGVTDRPEAETLAVYQLIKERADFQNELAKNNMHLLGFRHGFVTTLGSKTPVKTLADFKGKSLRAVGASAVGWSALGASPVSMNWGEIYSALERGVIWGVDTAHINGMYDAKFQEVVKNFTDCGLGNFGAEYLTMNLATWKKLPPDVQDAFNKAFEDFPQQSYAASNAAEKVTKDGFAKAGATLSRLSPADRQTVQQTIAPILSKQWIDDATKDGYKGQEIWDRYVALVKQYETSAPKWFQNAFESQ